ncbi:GMC family oxidoreductase [Streptomyces sp. SID13726]|uniref:GMC oxidoreductase n=1 Tax=Streptomyces sp. SID13726 TaxID=2706058 RepID=UPI0013BE1ECF|nr:GMC family oxidoreductase [Streptomyces sp. SID13726]NEB00796.1 GMC family oxidoreductase [Streptomyces sp. SID13726]
MKVESFDVCVVGSGASGAIAAQEIAAHGLRVLVLEEGRTLDPGESLPAIESAWETALVPTPGGPLRPLGRPWSASAVGGGTALYAGISFRLRGVDMDARAHVAPDALDPAWPIGYEELRPYYDRIERCIGVSRAPGTDPLEPPGPPAVMPAHPYSTQGRLLADSGRRIGLRPFPTPLAINSVPYAGRPACVRCGPCNEHVCPTGARANAATLLTDAAVPPGALTVAHGAKALRIVLRDRYRAACVEWLDLRTRTLRTTRVRCVVLAANAVQSAALLLRSAQPGAENGLGNSTDMVGRGLSFKISGYVSGTVDAGGFATAVPAPEPAEGASAAEAAEVSPWQGEGDAPTPGHPDRSSSDHAGPRPHIPGGPFSTVAFSDHYLDPDAPSGLGGLLYEASDEDRALRDGRIRLRVHFLAADQPMRDNAVRLARERGPLNLPRLVIDYATHPLDKRRLGYLSRRASELLAKAGADDIRYEDSNYQLGSRHLHGGCRAGTDPAESVVDPFGRVHDLDNVYVVDGGYFPYSGGVNPTFTIQANALRIARRIAVDLSAMALLPLVDERPGPPTAC